MNKDEENDEFGQCLQLFGSETFVFQPPSLNPKHQNTENEEYT
jgi:hypothetical protein